MSKIDSYLNKKILIIESRKKDINKTWCFWDVNDSKWNSFLAKKWSNIKFKNSHLNLDFKLENMTYNMIKSHDFFKTIKKTIKSKMNVEILNEEVLSIDSQSEKVKIKTTNNSFLGKKVFNSIPNFSPYNKDSKLKMLLQHFKGWTIKTKNKCFNDKMATIMDFSIEQKNETRFFYVLPVSTNEALVEFTLFSKKELNDSEYEQEILNYLDEKGISDYKVISDEKGIIPMTCFDYRKYNTKNLINIGTSGGWTKPSTGYTFKFIDKKSSKLLSFMQTNNDFRKFEKKTRFWYYDRIFLDVLYYHNHLGSYLFQRLFVKNKIERIFKFLDNESSLLDDMKITLSFPKILFTKTFFKTLFKY